VEKEREKKPKHGVVSLGALDGKREWGVRGEIPVLPPIATDFVVATAGPGQSQARRTAPPQEPKICEHAVPHARALSETVIANFWLLATTIQGGAEKARVPHERHFETLSVWPWPFREPSLFSKRGPGPRWVEGEPKASTVFGGAWDCLIVPSVFFFASASVR
jgi:hypothetical protein